MVWYRRTMIWRRQNPSGASSDTEHLREQYGGKGGSSVDDHYWYNDSDLRRQTDQRREGDRVTWYGSRGEMIRIDPDYVRSLPGNYFYPEKIGSVIRAVRSGDRPSFMVGYGEVSLIDHDRVDEDQEMFDNGELLVQEPLKHSDVGKLLYTIRDGNHRVFGALAGGETKVWIHLMKNDLRDVHAYREAKAKRKLAEFRKEHGKHHATLVKMLSEKLEKD